MRNSKSCPRCRGNLFYDEDVGLRFEKCLQCGYEREVKREHSVRESGPVRNIKTDGAYPSIGGC